MPSEFLISKFYEYIKFYLKTTRETDLELQISLGVIPGSLIFLVVSISMPWLIYAAYTSSEQYQSFSFALLSFLKSKK